MPASVVATFQLQLMCQTFLASNFTNATSSDVSSAFTGPLATRPRPAFPDGYSAFPEIGVALKYYSDENKNWNDARKACIGDGGNLAVIDSTRKMELVLNITDKKWITHTGMHRYFAEGEWTSVRTGLHVSTIPWTVGNMEDPEWQCTAMWEDGSGIYPCECSRLRKYVCEIPLPID